MSKLEEATRLYEQATLIAQQRRPDRVAVIALLEESAKLGNGQAACALGDWARRGVGGESSPARAAKYYKLAAELGSSSGAFDYAKSLEIGFGVRKSERKAREAYLLSAMLGNDRAAFEFYRCLWHGIGGRQDRNLAKAVRGHFEALGRFAERGKTKLKAGGIRKRKVQRKRA
jgi:TPR repeat protein